MTDEHDALQQIYQSTRGYCHRCRRKLAFTGYARAAVRGAWDIDGAARRPACTTCLPGHVTMNMSEKTGRARPLAPPRPAPATLRSATSAAPSCRHTLLGGLLGAFVAGPWGALLGSLLGAEVDGGGER